MQQHLAEPFTLLFSAILFLQRKEFDNEKNCEMDGDCARRADRSGCAGGSGAVSQRHEKLTRSYPNIPVETVNIPTDPDAVARGRHIAVVWACTKCHGENLSGMLLADDPFLGTIPASNLTSGKGGIAESYTHTDWIRAIRHGVKPDSRGEIFMYDYSTMSDQDLGALIAYLKQIPPVDLDYPAMRLGPIIPIAPAVGLFTPAAELIDHDALRPADPVPGATIEYGRYLSALCTECHSTSLAGKLENWNQEDWLMSRTSARRPAQQ